MRMNVGRAFRLTILAVILLPTITGPAFGLCPTCKATIGDSENPAELAQTVNSAILVLLVPTLLIICGLIRLVFKYVNFRSSDSQRDFE
jgi:hypothetical protein